MNIKKNAQQGFTLIELMIVIAIVGILAAIALPAYQDYLVRSRMSEPMAAMAEAKTSVAEYLASRNILPADNTEAGLKTLHPAKPFLNTLEYTGSGARAVIKVYVTSGAGGALPVSQAANNEFAMLGTVNTTDNEIMWECTTTITEVSAPVKSNYLPATCR